MVVCNGPTCFCFGFSSRGCVTRVVFIFKFVWFKPSLCVSIHKFNASTSVFGVDEKFLYSYLWRLHNFLPKTALNYVSVKSVNMLIFSRCSQRIYGICEDYRLWRDICACCDGSKPRHNHLQSIFTDYTTRIEVSSSIKVSLRQRQLKLKSSCLEREFFKKLENSPNLESFILKNHSFDITMVSYSTYLIIKVIYFLVFRLPLTPI